MREGCKKVKAVAENELLPVKWTTEKTKSFAANGTQSIGSFYAANKYDRCFS